MISSSFTFLSVTGWRVPCQSRTRVDRNVFRAAALSLVVFALVANSSAGLLCKRWCDRTAARTANQVACHHADDSASRKLVTENLCNGPALGDVAIIKGNETSRLSSTVASEHVEFELAAADPAVDHGLFPKSRLEQTFATRPPSAALRI